MKIVVLAGGLSPERDVSLSSGSLIANALIETGHEVVLVDIYEGIDVPNNDYGKMFKNKEDNIRYEYKVKSEEPDLEEIKRKTDNSGSLIGKNVLELCKYADTVFIGLHGDIGENGKLQALFDILGIKYTGSGYEGGLLAMDKNLTKIMLKQFNIKTADWIFLNTDNNVSEIVQKIEFPCVVKPCTCGSSVGISIIQNEEELENAILVAKRYESQIIIETFIKGREFSQGILNGKALPPIEIIPKEGFYDYKNKYQAGLTEEICPANLTEEQTKELGEIALKIHDVLRLGIYSRIDFILDENGNFYCLEANTLPGMTPTSLLPQEAMVDGITYKELCNKIVELSI